MKNKLKFLILIILSLPKTLYFNLKVFDLKKALIFPVFVSYKIKLLEIHRNGIVINAPIHRAMIVIGVGGTPEVQSNKNGIIKIESGQVQFNGKAHFSEGCSIRNKGTISIGNNFCANKNFVMSCGDTISIGDDNMLGWNIKLIDGDGHKVMQNGVSRPVYKPIHIGNHCWICSEVHILKGVSIGNDCIIAYRTLVTHSFDDNNVLIAGSPDKIVKSGVCWIE